MILQKNKLDSLKRKLDSLKLQIYFLKTHLSVSMLRLSLRAAGTERSEMGNGESLKWESLKRVSLKWGVFKSGNLYL